jgi:flagellar motility protein MotE (MotC chaperone)
MMPNFAHIAILASVALFAFCSALHAEDTAKGSSTPQLPSADTPTQTLAKDYCDAFARNAQQARNDRERAELTAMQEDISSKLKELSDKTAALQNWVDQRNAILNTATDAVIKIYATMDASAAATELTKLDPMLASAILRKLNPKKTSAILVEMDPKHAATLVSIMTADSKLLQGEKS